jgi:hypothetical protein
MLGAGWPGSMLVANTLCMFCHGLALNYAVRATYFFKNDYKTI